jgi:glycosyltransferase involved in cell wall biosynthesis
MKDIKYKVLFLSSWYPSRVNKVLGVFVKRKAETMSAKCDVALIYVTLDESLNEQKYDIIKTNENNVLTIRVYFAPAYSGVLKKIFYNIRYVNSWYKGYKSVKAEWGIPDLIHVNVVDRAGYIALLIKYLKNIKYVITEHSTPDVSFLKGETDKTSIPLLPLKKLVVKNAEYINVDSHPSMHYWKKAGLKGNYGVIANVVEVNPRFIKPVKEKNDNIIRAVHISMLMERKNVADIIRAYSHIYNVIGRKNIEFHIIGEGEQKEMLIDLAEKSGVLNNCVFFHGFVDEDEKLEMLVNSDFHIINSDEEGFSVVTAEAILYGIPVIATKCGGPEDFVPEEAGLLINRRSPNELTNAVLYMLDNSQNYKREYLQEYGRRKFSPEVIRDLTYKVYKTAATSWKAGNTASTVNIKPDWKVLDVGSGHQPFRRANIIMERYLEPTIHRTNQSVPVPSDKNMIVADALSMPYKSKSFNFLVASHIAEHVDDPVTFCHELMRVSQKGYIETPGPLTEFMMPTNSHKWVVKKKGNKLIFETNPYTKPYSRLFFSIFYLNREGYSDKPLFSQNILLKILNFILISSWKYIPGAYSILRWEDKFEVEVNPPK